jgi:hypothetical protein
MHTYYVTYVLPTFHYGNKYSMSEFLLPDHSGDYTYLKETEICYFMSQWNVHQIVENIDVHVF